MVPSPIFTSQNSFRFIFDVDSKKHLNIKEKSEIWLWYKFEQSRAFPPWCCHENMLTKNYLLFVPHGSSPQNSHFCHGFFLESFHRISLRSQKFSNKVELKTTVIIISTKLLHDFPPWVWHFLGLLYLRSVWCSSIETFLDYLFQFPEYTSINNLHKDLMPSL